MDDLLEGYIPTQLELHRMAPTVDKDDKEMLDVFLESFKDTRFDHKWIWGKDKYTLTELNHLATYLKKRGWRVHAAYQDKFWQEGPRLVVYPRGFLGGIEYHLLRWFV